MKGSDELKAKDDRLSLRINSEDKKKIQIRSIEKGFKNLSDYIIYACNEEMGGALENEGIKETKSWWIIQ